jgi:hypothetical protein
MENTTYQTALLSSLPEGEHFKIIPCDGAKVYKRSSFDRSARKYWADDCGDISNARLLKGSMLVFVGFTY